MRYSDSHKEETRRRVLSAAAAAVRLRGPDGVSVAEIMGEAGLTHGGFYAHFPSKEALVAAAIEEAFAQGRRRFLKLTEGLGRDEALAAFIDAYVSVEHRDRPERGCPLASLISDLPRQGPAVRAAFDAGVARLNAGLAAWLPGEDPETRLDLAASVVAEMAGAVALARAVSDPALAQRLLSASRSLIKARVGLPAGVTAASQKGA